MKCFLRSLRAIEHIQVWEREWQWNNQYTASQILCSSLRTTTDTDELDSQEKQSELKGGVANAGSHSSVQEVTKEVPVYIHDRRGDLITTM